MATVNIASRTSTLLGTISTSSVGASTSYVTFGSLGASGTYMGTLTLIAGGGGSVAQGVWVLAASLDQGATWFTLDPTNPDTPQFSSDPLLLPSGGITTGPVPSGGPSVSNISQYNISGLSGALFQYGLIGGTVASPMTIYALVG